MDDQGSILTLQPQMGYRWNRLDPRNSKMLTEKSGTGSVRFYNRFSGFSLYQNPNNSLLSNLVQIHSYIKISDLQYVTSAGSGRKLFNFVYI